MKNLLPTLVLILVSSMITLTGFAAPHGARHPAQTVVSGKGADKLAALRKSMAATTAQPRVVDDTGPAPLQLPSIQIDVDQFDIRKQAGDSAAVTAVKNEARQDHESKLERAKVRFKEFFGENGDQDGEPDSLADHFGAVFKFKKNHSDLAKSLEGKISDAEIAAVHQYSSFQFGPVNEALRDLALRKNSFGENEAGQISTEEWTLMIISAMNKLPPAKPRDGRGPLKTIRGEFNAGFSEKENQTILETARARFKSFPDPKIPAESKKIFVNPSFLSTSRGSQEDFKEQFLANALIHIRVVTRNGKDVEAFSTRPNEEEILLLPNSRFRVLRKETVAAQPTERFPFKERFEVDLEEL